MVTDVGRKAHHELFADRVNRRVRHLGEQLLEVVKQRLRLVRKHGKCGIVTHGANRLCTVLGHRLQDDGEVFGRIAKALLLHQNVFGNVGRVDFAEESANTHLVLGNPAAVRLATRHLSLHFGILQNTVVFEVEVDNFTRLQATLFFDFVVMQVKHARFGSHHEQTIFT